MLAHSSRVGLRQSHAGTVGGERLTLIKAAGIVPGAGVWMPAQDTAATELLLLSVRAGPTLGKDRRTSSLLLGGF